MLNRVCMLSVTRLTLDLTWERCPYSDDTTEPVECVSGHMLGLD